MKLKNRKSASKRVKFKKNAIVRRNAYKSHLLRRKNARQLRRLSAPNSIHESDVKCFILMCPTR
jgi:large subunit ribosomal protein L35